MKNIYKTIIGSLILGAALSLSVGLIPINWEKPNVCCDIPTGGTNWGYPLVVKSISCCGIAGPSHPFRKDYKINYLYNFAIYSAAAFIAMLVIFRIRKHD